MMNGRAPLLTLTLALTVAFAAVFAADAAAAGNRKAEPAPAPGEVRIALLADVPQWPEAVAPTQRLLDDLAQRKLHLVIHLGGIKGDTESCGDPLLTARLQLLNQSPVPLLYVPGEAEWVECEKPVAGSFDADERLARVRELYFPDDRTLGRKTLPVMRQSDQAKFRSYRENVRATVGTVLVVGLNVPGDNNNYRYEAGRNGEFEDRREANRQWLQRAFTIARQENLPGIVIVMHADPVFANGWEKRGQPTLLDGFVRGRSRDGFLEIKRQLRTLVGGYRGQVLLVHSSLNGFGVDTPLRDAQGKPMRNFTRVALPVGSPLQWTELTISPDSPALFSVNLRDGPRAP